MRHKSWSVQTINVNPNTIYLYQCFTINFNPVTIYLYQCFTINVNPDTIYLYQCFTINVNLDTISLYQCFAINVNPDMIYLYQFFTIYANPDTIYRTNASLSMSIRTWSICTSYQAISIFQEGDSGCFSFARSNYTHTVIKAESIFN